MAMVNIHEAETQLSRLLRRVQAGEDIVIARAGTPIARLAPIEPARQVRALGQWAGRVSWSDDFDAA